MNMTMTMDSHLVVSGKVICISPEAAAKYMLATIAYGHDIQCSCD